MPKKIRKKKEVKPLIQPVTSMVEISEKEKKQRRAKLEKIVSKVNKRYGRNLIQFGSDIEVKEVKRVHISAVPSLSFAIGGGIPRGRVITVSGPESSCKSAIGYRVLAEFQRQGDDCALIDVEGTYTDEWGEIHGIDNELLIYNRPESAEEGMNVAAALAEEGIPFIMLDSVEALSPKNEMEKDMDEGSRLALKPQLLGMFLRKMNAINNKLVREGKEGVTLFLVNQLREKPMTMGDPEYEPGGRALRFYASVQFRIRRGDWIREGSGRNQRIVGQVVKFKVTKNKTYPFGHTGEFDFYTDYNALDIPPGSFDTIKQLIVEGIAWGIIEQPSQGYYLVDGKKIHGRDKLIETVRYNVKLAKHINDRVLELVRQNSKVEKDPYKGKVDYETGEVLE